MKRTICTVIPAIIAFCMAKAQNPEIFSFNPDITPSAETFQINKYGNIVPSLYTGSMSYTVPLYTYNDEDFNIPMTLQYNFDGYRPAVHSGTVGYGWALDCGGSITREVRGYPDETAIGEGNLYGFYWTVQDKILNSTDYIIKSGRMRVDYVWNISFEEAMNMDIYSDMPLYCDRTLVRDSKYETAPDLFHFKFLGITGDFMLKDDGTMEVFNSSVPEGEITIEYNFINTETYIAPEFTINTGNGYKYIFGGTFNTVEYNVFEEEGTSITPSAFKLRKIIAPNGNEATFSYGHHLKETKQITAFYTNLQAINDHHFQFSDIMPRTLVISVFSPPVTGIEVNGKQMIEFTYEESGYDEDSKMSYLDPNSNITHYYQFYYQKPADLRKINISNWSGDEVASVSLDKSFIGISPSRMFLTGIGSTIEGQFSFYYNTDGYIPPHNNTNATDFQGFWNGGGFHGKITEYLDLNNLNSGLYNQFMSDFTGKDPFFTTSSFGGLSKIVYPTGGESKITYEQNTVSRRVNKDDRGPYYESCPSENEAAGGVRVKRIDNTGNDICDHVEYLYSSFDNISESSGILMYMPLYGMKTDYRYKLLDNEYIIVHTLGFTDQCDTSPRRDPSVVYPQVTEIFENGSYNTYEFEWQEDIYPNSQNNYRVIKKNLGRQQILLPDDDNSYYAQAIRNYVLPPMLDFSQTRGLLKEKREHDTSNRVMRSETITYKNYAAYSRKSYFNALLDFVEMDCKWYSSRVSKKVNTVYYESGDTFESGTSYFYNDGGQIETEQKYSNLTPRTEFTGYRYCSETIKDCPKWLKGAVSDIAKNVTCADGKSYVISVSKFQYSTSSGNPYPVSATVYSSAIPAMSKDDRHTFSIPENFLPRAYTYYYDDKYRLIMAGYPGGAYIKYLWDSDKRHIIKRERDSAENSWQYEWKDLVGLTKVTYPATGFNGFVYDRNNRLSVQYNLNGDVMYRYMYHLKNE